jgi:peptidoglycan/xylan/chitin deacetylase (PgdA/CDA1 family)
MRYYKTPYTLQRIFSSFVWKIPQNKPTIYLTFDDGPIPELTPWVLETLATFQAKATFFCVGDNIRKHPSIFQQILQAEHQVGNHTFYHLNAWKTDKKKYLADVHLCKQEIEKYDVSSRLFRPPYGRLSLGIRQKIQQHHQIVLWDVLSYDFDQTLSPESCLRNTLKYTENGSIVVFHDNLKAKNNLTYALPRLLEHFASQAYHFASI